MRITYYLDVLSSWCLWAEPAWDELQTRFADQIAFNWKIALINPTDFPRSKEECAWRYRRSAAVIGSTPILNPNWFEPQRKGDFRAPNLVAEAGRDFGATDDRLYRALAHAGMIEGKQIGDLVVAATIGAKTIQASAEELRRHAQSNEVLSRIVASTAEFHAQHMERRPSFLLENDIEDKVVISGLATAPPLMAVIEAMLSDAKAYAAYAAEFGEPPGD